MGDTWEHKRTATNAVKQLDLPPDMRERALVLVAADSVAGNNLRALLQLNQSDAGLSNLVKRCLINEAAGSQVVAAGASSLSDLIKLGGKVKVLARGDPETGQTKSISLYRSGADPVSLQDNNGKLAGRLYLKNVNVMVHGDVAMVEVLAPEGEVRPPFLPEENSNGLSEELFAFDSIIKVSTYKGLSLARALVQDFTSNCNAFATQIGPFLEFRNRPAHPKPD